MKCVKCGNELQPGTRFCVFCGTPVSETAEPAAAETPVTPAPQEGTPVVQRVFEEPTQEAQPADGQQYAQPTPQPADGQQYAQPTPQPVNGQQYAQPTPQPVNGQQYAQPTPQPVNGQQYAQPTPQQAYEQPDQESVQKKSKKVLVGVIIAVVALVAVLAVAVAAIFLLKGKGSSEVSKQLSYAKNGKLYYVKDIRKDDEPILVCNIKNASDYGDSSYLSGMFTEDGKYLYFYNKMENSYTGKLCRVEVSKLKGDSDKDEELIEELVSGVMNYTLLGDDCFVYQTDSYDLYYYNGEDKDKITSNVSYYSMTDDNTKVKFTTNDYQIGYYNIADDATEIVIENCSYIVAETEKGTFYTKYNDETWTYDLYYGSDNGDTEKVASNTYNILSANERTSTVYYVTERTEEVCYYDLVNDVYADADANITQPVATMYLTPCTEYDAMSDWDREYYTEYPEYIDSFYYWLYQDYNYGTGMLSYYSSHVDAEGNYIYGYYFYDEVNAQWYAFDEAAYNEAWDTYNSVSDRIYLRDSLKNATMTLQYYDLHSWKPESGEDTVAANIRPYSASLLGNSGIVIYQKYGSIEKIDWPEDAYGIWFVDDYIYNVRYGEAANSNYYCNNNGNEGEWNSDWGDLGDNVYFSTSPSGQYMMAFAYSYDENYNYTSSMSAYRLAGDSLELIEKDIAKTSGGVWVEDEYYYFDGSYDTEGDLCCFANGKSSTVLKNISNAAVLRYENGTCSAYTDYNYYDGGTLKLFRGDGENVKIDTNVNAYCYIDDELVVYLRDGKLYVYRGEDKEKFKIDSSVSSFTCDQADYEMLMY